jgi:hypothetical protein
MDNNSTIDVHKCETSHLLSINIVYNSFLILYSCIISIAFLLNIIFLFIICKVNVLDSVIKVTLFNIGLTYTCLTFNGNLIQLWTLVNLYTDDCNLQVCFVFIYLFLIPTISSVPLDRAH